MTTLCYVAIPQNWESPKGVMMRTALHNGYGNVKSMCMALRVPCHSDAIDLLTEQSLLIKKLAMAAPEVEQALFHNIYTLNNVGAARWIIDDIALSRSQFSKHFIYCPECLLTEVITVFQDIKDVPVCPLHQVRLVTQCPACLGREHWTTASLLFCECGFDRRNAEAQKGKLYDEERLETFGPTTYINRLSRLADLAQICDEIWQFRKPCDEKTIVHLTDTVQDHALKMISTQLAKFPGFTRAVHLAPWTSSHPLLEKLADRIINENYTVNSTCPSDQCCAEVELTFPQIINAIGGKKTWSKHRKLVSNNFEASLDSPQPTFYRSHIKICKFVNLIYDRNVNLEREKTDTGRKFCTVAEAADLLSCGHETVRKLGELGYLQRTNKNNEQRKRQAHFFLRKSVTDFNRSYILLENICQTLNTKPFKLAHQLNLLGIASDHDNLGPYVYKKHKIIDIWDKLKKELEKPLKLYPIAFPPTQDIQNIFITTSASIATFDSINHSTNLNNGPLPETDTSYYTANQAAKILHISTQLLRRRFLLTGLITPESPDGTPYYSSENIQEMHTHLEHHLTIYQASKILKCAVNQIYSRVSSFKLRPSGALIYSDGTRLLLYSKNDIYNLENHDNTQKNID